jgi:hypothetical protein
MAALGCNFQSHLEAFVKHWLQRLGELYFIDYCPLRFWTLVQGQQSRLCIVFLARPRRHSLDHCNPRWHPNTDSSSDAFNFDQRPLCLFAISGAVGRNPNN